MFKRYALAISFLMIITSASHAQELKRITPVKAEASSYYKDLNARLSSKYRQYREYLVDNSPEKAFDNDEKSMWVTKSKIKGEWIKIEFPYPVIASHLKVLTGLHLTDELFRMTKTVKKFEVENDQGEKTKLTIKNPAEHAGFELGFKKPTKTLKLTILTVENETYSNSGTTTGFADIVVGHQVYDTEGLAVAIEAEELPKMKKELKAAMKKVSNPHAITVRGQNPIVWATETGKAAAAQYLWENGFRFINSQNTFLTSIQSQDQLTAHFNKINTLKSEVNALMTRLNTPDLAINWLELNDIESDLETKYEILGKAYTDPIASQIEVLRPKVAESELRELITSIAKSETTTLNKLNKISSLENQEREKYYWLSEKGKKKFETYRNDIIKIIFESHAQSMSRVITRYPDKTNTVLILNMNRKAFEKDFNAYNDHPSFKDIQTAFQKKKTTIVEKYADQLREKITQLENLKQVENLKRTYFSWIDNTAVTVGLTNELSARKRAVITEMNARKAAEKKAELERKKAELKRIYSQLLENSKREITVEEWRQVTRAIDNERNDELEHFYPKEMDIYAVFSAYLLNHSFNTVYVHNQAKNESARYLSAQKAGERIAFTNDQDIESYWNPDNGMITYRSRPRVKKVVDSGAWSLAQRCRSVKNYLETTTTNELTLVSVVVHKPTGIPVLFKTSLGDKTCVLRGAYDNCSLPCFKYVNQGSDNWYFYVSDYMRQWNVK